MIAYHYSYWDKRENTWPSSEIHPEIRVQLSYNKVSALKKDNRSHVWLSRLIMQRANQKPERESTSIFVISVEKDLETPVTMDVFFHFLGTEFWRDYTLTSPYTRPVKLLSTQCFHCFVLQAEAKIQESDKQAPTWSRLIDRSHLCLWRFSGAVILRGSGLLHACVGHSGKGTVSMAPSWVESSTFEYLWRWLPENHQQRIWMKTLIQFLLSWVRNNTVQILYFVGRINVKGNSGFLWLKRCF